MDIYEKWLLSKLKKYEIISFDIYDTLIHRTFGTPFNVFKMIQKKINKTTKVNEDFIFNREQAVKRAWEKTEYEEITLDEIYRNYKKGHLNIDLIKQLEVETEIDCVYPDKRMRSIYKKLKKSKKRIILVSDMYLSKSVIEKILEKCGYDGYEKLYLSSNIMLKKRTGHLFEFVKKDLQEEFVHIGDNYISDYKKAKESGIESVWYAPSAIKQKLHRYLL